MYRIYSRSIMIHPPSTLDLVYFGIPGSPKCRRVGAKTCLGQQEFQPWRPAPLRMAGFNRTIMGTHEKNPWTFPDPWAFQCEISLNDKMTMLQPMFDCQRVAGNNIGSKYRPILYNCSNFYGFEFFWCVSLLWVSSPWYPDGTLSHSGPIEIPTYGNNM